MPSEIGLVLSLNTARGIAIYAAFIMMEFKYVIYWSVDCGFGRVFNILSMSFLNMFKFALE